MEKNKHLGIHIDDELHFKLHHISKYDGRSASGQIIYLIRQCITAFEAANVEIELPKSITNTTIPLSGCDDKSYCEQNRS